MPMVACPATRITGTITARTNRITIMTMITDITMAIRIIIRMARASLTPMADCPEIPTTAIIMDDGESPASPENKPANKTLCCR